MRVTTFADQLFFCTTRIEAVDAAGSASVGTGFFFIHQEDGKGEVPVLVTNRHVIQNTVTGTIFLTQMLEGEPVLGKGINLAISPEYWRGWHCHPNPDIDVAILALEGLFADVKAQTNMDFYVKALESSLIPTAEQILELDSIESVTFVGYPNGVWDKQNRLPIARKGTTATPISVDFENTPRFLIDASVFGGSSGSPVFIHDRNGYSTNGGFVVGERIHFLGLIAAVFYRTAFNRIVPAPIPTHQVPVAEQMEMIDLGIVFKAKTISETIENALQLQEIRNRPT